MHAYNKIITWQIYLSHHPETLYLHVDHPILHLMIQRFLLHPLHEPTRLITHGEVVSRRPRVVILLHRTALYVNHWAWVSVAEKLLTTIIPSFHSLTCVHILRAIAVGSIVPWSNGFRLSWFSNLQISFVKQSSMSILRSYSGASFIHSHLCPIAP